MDGREELSELLGRGGPAEASPGAVVELLRDLGEVVGVVRPKIGAFGKVLAYRGQVVCNVAVALAHGASGVAAAARVLGSDGFRATCGRPR